VADRRHPTVTGDVQRRRHAVPRATVGRGGRRDQPRIPLIFLLIAVAGGFTTAGAILVARSTPAPTGTGPRGSSPARLSSVSPYSRYSSGSADTSTRPALEILPSDPDTAATVIPLAADYMEVIFAGIPLMFGFFVFSALMRGYGDTRTPMAVMVVSVFLNVLLDPFLIFGFRRTPCSAGWRRCRSSRRSIPSAFRRPCSRPPGSPDSELRVPQWRRYSLGGRHRDRPLAAVRHGARAGCLPEPSPPGSRVH